MNFFEEQERAKRNTGKLVVLMCLAVISLIAISSVSVAAILALLAPRDPNTPLTAQGWSNQLAAVFDWELVGTISLLVVGVVVAGSVFKHFQLRSGGKAVAESLDGRLIDPGSTEPGERKILNIVEEMAIASGIPVPPVYVLEDEGINAFAAGHTPQDAVIGVTRGCLSLLSRDELQGVVAHEFSHIFHGDMRLNTRLVATLNGILLIGLVGYILLRSAPWRRGGNRDNSGMIMLAIGLLLIVVGFAGTFFGNLIKAAVSRQREFLSDASAVQFTRNPSGIANALKKIGGYHAGSQIQAANASEYSHMFFSRAVSSTFSGLMATHPPLEERIRRVEPGWDGTFTAPELQPAVEQTPSTRPGFDSARDNVGSPARLGVLHAATVAGSLPSSGTPLPARASQDAIDAIGQPDVRHVAYARETMERLDPMLREAAQDGYSARALMYGLLLDTSESVRSRQLDALEREADPNAYGYVIKLADKLTELDPRLRLPLVGLCLPALKQLTDAQYTTFKHCMKELIRADDRISLMEWALYRIVVHNIEPAGKNQDNLPIDRLVEESRILLSAIVHAGHMDDDQARTAFDSAMAGLAFAGLSLLPRSSTTPVALEPAIIQLSRLEPLAKRRLIQALARAVEYDGLVTVEQAELLRAIADSLDCPLPPLLAAPPEIHGAQ